MQRDIPTLLAYEAKRKPVLAALVDRAGSLTDAEIEGCGYLKWIKSALTQKRSAERALAHIRATEATLLAHPEDQPARHPLGTVYRWVGQSAFVNVDRGGQIMIDEGTLVWMPKETPGIWIRTIYSNIIDPRFHQMTRLIGEMEKPAYIAKYKAELEAATPDDVPVIMQTGGQPTLQPALDINFIRF